MVLSSSRSSWPKGVGNAGMLAVGRTWWPHLGGCGGMGRKQGQRHSSNTLHRMSAGQTREHIQKSSTQSGRNRLRIRDMVIPFACWAKQPSRKRRRCIYGTVVCLLSGEDLDTEHKR